jgi:serine/threonine protein kinase
MDKSRMNNEDEVRLKYEVEILSNLIHPNIVRLYEVYQSKESIFLVTELCDGKELFEEITSRKKFTEKQAASVTKQILQAIAYCHESHICHRDLKPENVLIDAKNGGSLKVIDFGTSQVFSGNQKMH